LSDDYRTAAYDEDGCKVGTLGQLLCCFPFEVDLMVEEFLEKNKCSTLQLYTPHITFSKS
jgi:hypothetical protein